MVGILSANSSVFSTGDGTDMLPDYLSSRIEMIACIVVLMYFLIIQKCRCFLH